MEKETCFFGIFEMNINFPHIFPLICLVAGFILASLCLAAGNKPGFMEEYALVRVGYLPYLICLVSHRY